jgi:hypothetical protein
MGRLSIFSKAKPTVQRLPSGSLTVDGNGRVLACTVSSACPPETLRQISNRVLQLFLKAREVQIPLAELTLQFGSLQITARELRGGAIIFLKPKA